MGVHFLSSGMGCGGSWAKKNKKKKGFSGFSVQLIAAVGGEWG